MKTITQFLLLLILTSCLSCQEIPPIINYINASPLVSDTAYFVKTLPTAQKKNVLLEDVSGVKCVNCPEAAVVAHDLQEKYGHNRVVILTLHTFEQPKNTEPFVGDDTLNSLEATQIISNLLGEPQGFPMGAINRIVYPGNSTCLLFPPMWAVNVDEQIKRMSTVNLQAEIIDDASTGKIFTNVKATFLKDIPEGAYLSIFVSESQIVGSQKFTSGVQKDYEHNFILRKGITPYNGVRLSNSIQTGQVFEKGFEFDLSEKWAKENCSIVVLVNKVSPNDNQVLQCIELPIIQ